MINLGTYAEYGAIGVIVILFIGMIKFLQTSLIAKLTSVEVICVKLIDRWNSVEEKQERRYEKSVEIQNNVTDTLNFIKGRLNNKGG